MPSAVDICNQALGELGQDFIISLDDEVKSAQLCKAKFASLRDAVLESRNWTFAIRRAVLPAEVDAPAFGFGKSYPLPATVLRVITMNQIEFEDRDGVYVVEDRRILTDDSSCRIKYIYQETDTTRFSPLFVQALAARLAADLAIPLTQSRSLRSENYDLYGAKLREAAALDGMQGKQRRIRSRWLHNARNAGSTRTIAGPEV